MISLIHLILPSNSWASQKAEFELVPSQLVSSEGYITFSWSSTPSGSHTIQSPMLQVAANPTFEPLIRQFPLHPLNLDNAQIHVTGLSDGHYHARLWQPENSALSNVVQFQVEHRDVTTAFFIFGVGLALFLVLGATLFRFSQKGN